MKALAGMLLCALCGCAGQARLGAELRSLTAKVKGFCAVELPAKPGRVELSLDQALTIERLRGIALDGDPPVMGKPPKPYDPRMTDDFPTGEAPYVARGILPFRFRHFNCEFNYGGWHNFAMCDYALTHGFNVLSPYARKPEDWPHVPKGTKFLFWGGFVDWEKWLPKHGIPEGRYDKLAGLDLAGILASEGVFKPNSGFEQLMIDMEHPLLAPEQLRKQPWYPANATEAERNAFEKRYYDGYAKTYVAPIQAARKAGWKNVSLYGWEPFARTFWGLENVKLDPATYWAWNLFGKQIYAAADILNPSVYCFYWSPKNVSYVLANIDLNRKLADSMPVSKPMRPYYWTLLHGGGTGWRWWANQPIPNEDVRAMTALSFFTGFDGLVLWNWSGTGSHHVPEVKLDSDVMIGRPFQAKAEGADSTTSFERYDALHITEVSKEATVKFQRIEKRNARGQYGVGKDKPVYAMASKELLPVLRPLSEPVAAMIEGMALVRPFEYLLRHGEVKIDVSAQEQFGKDLPIVRRVKLGGYHVIATYDPGWATAKGPRQIVLDDFDGHQGLTLVLPADAQTRLFVLLER